MMNLNQARRLALLLHEAQPPAGPWFYDDPDDMHPETVVERTENHSTSDGVDYIFVKLACYDSTLVVFPIDDLYIRDDSALCLWDEDVYEMRPCDLSWRHGAGGGIRDHKYHIYLDAMVKEIA